MESKIEYDLILQIFPHDIGPSHPALWRPYNGYGTGLFSWIHNGLQSLFPRDTQRCPCLGGVYDDPQ